MKNLTDCLSGSVLGKYSWGSEGTPTPKQTITLYIRENQNQFTVS